MGLKDMLGDVKQVMRLTGLAHQFDRSTATPRPCPTDNAGPPGPLSVTEILATNSSTHR